MKLSKTMMFEARVIADAEDLGIEINKFCERALIFEIEDRRKVADIDTAVMVRCPNPVCALEFSSLIWTKKPELKGKCYSCGTAVPIPAPSDLNGK